MSQLVESIRIENQKLQLIELHNQRLNRAMQDLFGQIKQIQLAEFINIPSNLTDSRYKCRVTISPVKIEVNIDPYFQREIKTLMIVYDNDIDYTYKSDNRLRLDEAYIRRGNCDDIIIIKNGFVTDSWAANILLFDGTDWITPDTPLLKGIQREFLLSQNLIKQRRVLATDLLSFERIKLVNALIDFERAPEILLPDGLFFENNVLQK